MKRMSWLVIVAFGLVALVGVLCQYSSGFAQSGWPFGGNQEEKMRAQRQAPVERAFPKNYRKLDEKERAVAEEKYDEFLKERANSRTDDDPTPDVQQIKPLELPNNPFQSPDFKAFEGSTK